VLYFRLQARRVCFVLQTMVVMEADFFNAQHWCRNSNQRSCSGLPMLAILSQAEFLEYEVSSTFAYDLIRSNSSTDDVATVTVATKIWSFPAFLARLKHRLRMAAHCLLAKQTRHKAPSARPPASRSALAPLFLHTWETDLLTDAKVPADLEVLH